MANKSYELYLSSYIFDAYMEIKNTPFYKDGQVYKFARHILDDAKSNNNPMNMLSGYGLPDTLIDMFNEYMNRLSAIEVTEEDISVWVSYNESHGTVKEYHDTLEDFYQALLLHSIVEALGDDEPKKEKWSPEETSHDSKDNSYKLRIGDQYVEVMTRGDRAISKTASNNVVLNRNNPFADVTIEDQQFLYASDYGKFEVLSLNTNKTLTSVQKNEEQRYLALQPGFKIKKMSHIDPRQLQTISFDDTLTSEITQQDDKTYIYIG